MGEVSGVMSQHGRRTIKSRGKKKKPKKTLVGEGKALLGKRKGT